MPTRKPPRNLLTLSRIELYDLVWSQRLADVAGEFKMTEAELRTRCLEVHVPIPDEAATNLIRRGETPKRTPLPSPQEIRRLPKAATDPDPTVATPTGAKDPPTTTIDPTATSAPPATSPAPPPPLPTLPYAFTRESLYALVWTHPPRKLAMHFGMSDVAIAKRCRALLIPIPPRGYWARVQAGQRPPKPKLKALKPELLDASRLRFGIPSPERQAELDPNAAPPPVERTPIDDRLDALGLQPDAPEDWGRNADDSNPPPRWPEKLRGPARLPLLSTQTRQSETRGRRLLTHLIETAQKLGWKFKEREPDPTPSYETRHESTETKQKRAAHFLVEDEIIILEVKEANRRSDHVATEKELAKYKRDGWPRPERWDFNPSNAFTIEIGRGLSSWTFTTLKDSPRRPLERRIRDLLNGMYQAAQKIKLDRAEKEERERQERLAAERRERVRETREAHRELVSRLERDAGAWQRAQRLRRYLRAARRRIPPGQRLEAELQGERIDLLEFGERFANHLDPLHPAPREWQFMAGPTQGYSYSREDDDMKALRIRVTRTLGYDWEKASKLSAREPTPPEPDDA